MGDNNIETINLNKPGIIDMGFFIGAEEQAKSIMKTCEAAINIIGKSVREMVNLAGLDSVDFVLFNIGAVKQNIEENPNKLPGLMIFAGNDDTYEYSISATPSYSGKNEYPEEVMALLLRKNVENPIDDFCVFNFNDKQWVKADFAAHLGLTREQYDLFSKNQGDPRLPLFNIYKDFHGPMTNEEFDKFFEKNQQIVELHELTRYYTDFDYFLMNNGIIALCPLPEDVSDGLSVTYEDGYYSLNITTKGKILKSIAKISDIEQMAAVLSNFLDRKFPKDMLSFVPLSLNTAAVIHDSGECEYMHPSDEPDNTQISDEERKNFRMYVEACTHAAHAMAEQLEPKNINTITIPDKE